MDTNLHEWAGCFLLLIGMDGGRRFFEPRVEVNWRVWFLNHGWHGWGMRFFLTTKDTKHTKGGWGLGEVFSPRMDANTVREVVFCCGWMRIEGASCQIFAATSFGFVPGLDFVNVGTAGCRTAASGTAQESMAGGVRCPTPRGLRSGAVSRTRPEFQ